MSSTLQFILLMITFVAFVVYLIKGYNLIIGFFLMSVIWGLIGGLGWTGTLGQISNGITGYGNIAFTIAFGSWFGQVLVKTGITSSLIRKAVELGGDRPLVINILLCLITALIFTSSFGSGVVIAIGIIILPILFALGVPKPLAVGSFIMSIGTGVAINVVHFNQLATLIPGVTMQDYTTFGLITMAINFVLICIMIAVGLKKAKVSRAWAAEATELPEATAPVISFITPILPVIMVIAFGWPVIPCFIICIIIALLLTKTIFKPKAALSLTMQAIYDGMADIGVLLIMLVAINSFQTVAGGLNHIFQEFLGPIMPTNTLIIALIIGVLAPISLFRGPLSYWGTGVATISVLSGMGVFNPLFLFCLCQIPTNFMATAICPTQGWNMWGMSYGKVSIKDHFKTTFIPAWLTCIICAVVCYVMYGAL